MDITKYFNQPLSLLVRVGAEHNAVVRRRERRQKPEPCCRQITYMGRCVAATGSESLASQDRIHIPALNGHLGRDRDQRLAAERVATPGGVCISQEAIDRQRPTSDHEVSAGAEHLAHA